MGNVYISGFTQGGDLGGPNAGGDDAFVSKYDANGTLQWTQQLGTFNAEKSFGVSADGMGSVYISGYTSGDLGGTNAGLTDAFVAKYSDASNAVPEATTFIVWSLIGLSALGIRPRRFGK